VCIYVLSAAPGPVRDVKGTAISSSSINITWEEPNEPNGVVSYRVTVMSHGMFNTSDTFLVVDRLKPFTEYFIHVQPRTSVGFGDISEGYLVKTMQSSMLFLSVYNIQVPVV